MFFSLGILYIYVNTMDEGDVCGVNEQSEHASILNEWGVGLGVRLGVGGSGFCGALGWFRHVQCAALIRDILSTSPPLVELTKVIQTERRAPIRDQPS